MYANKNKNQYTTLIHEGENVTIDPPGFINAEGGGGGGGTVDPVTPFNIKHNGQIVASVNNDGDLTLGGTVYINRDTDIQELTPIFTADIIGDYEQGTFTSSQTFAEITEALETGHTLIARDTNGFVYQQTASEFDPETTDTIYFATVQPDGIYQLTWTGADRIITTVGSDSALIQLEYNTGTTISRDLYTATAAAISNGKTPYIVKNGVVHLLNDYVSIGYASYIALIYASDRLEVSTVYCYNDDASTTNDFLTTYIRFPSEFAKGGQALYVLDEQTNNVYTDPSGNNQCWGYDLRYKLKHNANYDATSCYYPNYYDSLIYIENGNWHICHLSERSGQDFIASSQDPVSYVYTCVDAFAVNTLIVYQITVTFTSDSTYTVNRDTYTYTIGA